MSKSYAKVRRQWRDTDIERELGKLWRSERFESPEAVAEALRIYEMAIRVEGWAKVRTWARAALAEKRILNAQLVELAMRALEQDKQDGGGEGDETGNETGGRGDREFLQEITRHLLDNSPVNYFRFYYTLFSTRHAHAGEQVFRAQLAELSDYRVVKYRRWIKRILRKLRFRCTTDRERAIGAIAFAMYDKYDAKAYPSEMFQAFLACHDAARTRKKTKTGKPVAKSEQMKTFATAAAQLGIWTTAEGIRTSAGLPRTRGYLAAMAPKMTDGELIRSLRAIDANLKTADHKRASETVVALAEHVHQRLGQMDVTLEEWCKIYPYQQSPVLLRVFEQLIGQRVAQAVAALEPLSRFAFVPIAPLTLAGRTFRAAFLATYLLYRINREASAYLAQSGPPRALVHPSQLWPYGYGVEPPAWRWQSEPDQPDRVLCELVRETFPVAAARKRATPLPMKPYIDGLRSHLYRRALVDRQASARDVPVLFLTGEPGVDERKALTTHLQMFASAVLVTFEKPWREPLADERVIHLNVSPTLADMNEQFVGVRERLLSQEATFLARQPAVDREVRHLLLGRAPVVQYVGQGPYQQAQAGSPKQASAGSSPPASAKGAADSHSVVLMGVGASKIKVIKALRSVTGLSLAATKKLVDSAPKVIKQSVSLAEAMRVRNALMASGAKVEIT